MSVAEPGLPFSPAHVLEIVTTLERAVVLVDRHSGTIREIATLLLCRDQTGRDQRLERILAGVRQAPTTASSVNRAHLAKLSRLVAAMPVDRAAAIARTTLQ